MPTDPAPILLPSEATPPVRSLSVPGPAGPSRQLAEMPKDELAALAEDLGIDPTRYKTRQLLVAALHERRQLIAGLDREAMLDVVRWGRRPVALNASRDQIAQEIARIKSMKFNGLSHRGLLTLAQLRGVAVTEADPVPMLVRKLRRKEGLLSKLSRKRRAMIGAMVAKVIGETESEHEYQFLPPTTGGPGVSSAPGPTRPGSLKEDIEESGLLGGLTNRIKKSADGYLNQKLDEIESRIDRKLDEIDRRLAEWRDKEIANRIRILKITLWASVIVGLFTLIYSYVKVYFIHG